MEEYPDQTTLKDMKYSLIALTLLVLMLLSSGLAKGSNDLQGLAVSETNNKNPAKKPDWQVGFGRKVITPQNQVWLAGYGTKRVSDGTIHDLWVKVMALKSPNGKRVVIATTDHMGMSRTVYESIYSKIHSRFKIKRSEFMLTFSPDITLFITVSS